VEKEKAYNVVAATGKGAARQKQPAFRQLNFLMKTEFR